MKQEDKELLLKDLCARLPYNPLISINGERYRMEEIRNALIGIDTYKITVDGCSIDSVKPYLFPLSSMTEEQKNDCPINETTLNIINSNIGCYGIIEIPWRLSFLFIDWCNKNHFDYRGLIPMGLANDATGLNIY